MTSARSSVVTRRSRSRSPLQGTTLLCALILPGLSLAPTSVHGQRPATVWAVAARPTLVIGDTGAWNGHTFDQVAGAFRRQDGRIVVGDVSASQIAIFDKPAEAPKRLGRFGRGPGEFEHLMALFRAGDSVIAEDARGVSQVFGPGNKFVRAVPRASLRGAEELAVHGYMDDGTAVATYSTASQAARDARGWRDFKRTLVLLRSRDTLVVDEFIWGRTRTGERGESQPEVFGAIGQVAVLPAAVCVGLPRVPAVKCFNTAGRLLGTVTVQQTNGPLVTAQDRRVWMQGIELANPGPRGRAYREYVARTTAFAERHAPFGRMVGSRDGLLWVGPVVPAEESLGMFNPVPDAPTRWQVFRVDGHPEGEVRLPAGFRLLEAGANYVLGTTKGADENDVVQLLDLKRSAAAPAAGGGRDRR